MSGTAEEQDEVAPPDDIRSALNSAFEEHATPEPAARVEKPERTETPVETPEKPVERARGPDGKFVRAEGEEGAEAPVKPEPAPVPTEPKPVEEDPIAKLTAKWSEADRAILKGLPEPAKELLLRRTREVDADHTRKTQQLAQERTQIATFRQDYEPIAQIFAPHAEIMRQKGLTPHAIVQAWANVEQELISGGPAAINRVKGIIQGYNIDPAQLVAALGIRPQAPQPGPNGELPQVAEPQPQPLPPEIVQRLTAHDQWIAEQTRIQNYNAQQQYNQGAQRVMSEIEQFASAMDSAGAPSHPYFAEVEADMTRLALAARTSGGPPPSLSELYEQAVWANPSTRAQLKAAERAAEEAQRAAAESTRQAEARAKAERSRRAGGSVQGAPGSTSPAVGRARSTGSVREDLMAAADELSDA